MKESQCKKEEEMQCILCPSLDCYKSFKESAGLGLSHVVNSGLVRREGSKKLKDSS